jgi:hypothetical protein
MIGAARAFTRAVVSVYSTSDITTPVITH